MRVSVVYDREFGTREKTDIGDAFWLIESPHNRAMAERLWAAGTSDTNSAVFRAHDCGLIDDDVLARFEDVDLHHPGWTVIDFVGIPLTRELRDHFTGNGLTVTSGDTAFSVAR